MLCFFKHVNQNKKRQMRCTALDAKENVGHGVQEQLAIAVRFTI
jgi:hypothetical protein